MHRSLLAVLRAVLLIGAGSGVAAAQGSAASTPKADALAAAAKVAAAPGAVKVNEFMSYVPATKTVEVALIGAYNSNLGGFNFNGGANGDHMITVPQGWTVRMHVLNVDAIPHSAIVINEVKPIPSAPDQPAIPRAYSTHVTDGLAPVDGADLMNFRATKAGHYMLVCGVPGHGPSGMWIWFEVSAEAQAPSYTIANPKQK
jgi:sulfocyanin